MLSNKTLNNPFLLQNHNVHIYSFLHPIYFNFLIVAILLYNLRIFVGGYSENLLFFHIFSKHK